MKKKVVKILGGVGLGFLLTVVSFLVFCFNAPGEFRTISVGWLPQGNAMTIGETIFIKDGKESPRLLCHERVHVAQFEEKGGVRFLANYAWDYVRGRMDGLSHYKAYKHIGFESEAYGHQSYGCSYLKGR